jgi:hypothetical protein
VSDDLCTCCELPVAYCGKAAETRKRNEAAAEKRRLLALPGAIAAQYPGTCAKCGEERFEVGDPIIRYPSGGWRALLCCERP